MEGYELLNKVSDRRDIVDFVREIEKYPCLYDKTLPEYANKVYNRRAWAVIAKKIHTTVPDCRDKWRKIRISYMRSLKQQYSDKPPMRPYYLSKDLQFLRPFLKINTKQTSSKAGQTEDQEEQIEEDMDVSGIDRASTQVPDTSSESDFTETLEIETEDERDINGVPFTDTNGTIKDKQKEMMFIKRGCYRNGYGEEKYCRSSYSDDIEYNPRKMFLLSLLPDVECFTESEMRIFRREVITVCDDIINRRVT